MPTTLHELQQRAKLGERNQDRVELCINFNELETTLTQLKHPSLTRRNSHFRLIKDKRSYQDAEGLWHVFPIALNPKYVWIVCPICQCVHLHGNNLAKKLPANWANHRRAHCGSGWLEKLYESNDYYDTSCTESGYDRHGYIIEKPNMIKRRKKVRKQKKETPK